MAGAHERKSREIKRSLNRRARIRRAYFKMIGENPTEHSRLRAAAEERARSASDMTLAQDSSIAEDGETDSEEVATKEVEEPSKLTKKQLASRRRAEAYHKAKELEQSREEAQQRRKRQKEVATKRTSKGQPRLGAQVGVLLDRIRKST